MGHTGSIVAVRRTLVTSGSPMDPSHVCVFTVTVSLDGGARYVATCRQSARASVLASLMQAGATVPVRVDPCDRSQIELVLTDTSTGNHAHYTGE